MTSLERALPQEPKWKQHLSAMLPLFQGLGVFGGLTTNTEVDCFSSQENVNSLFFFFQSCCFSILQTNMTGGAEREEVKKMKKTR